MLAEAMFALFNKSQAGPSEDEAVIVIAAVSAVFNINQAIGNEIRKIEP